jgi:hypothetical protein
MENPRMGTRGNMDEGKTQTKRDGWSKTNHGLRDEDTGDRDMCRKFWVKEKH